jgi:hypothetical protein
MFITQAFCKYTTRAAALLISRLLSLSSILTNDKNRYSKPNASRNMLTIHASWQFRENDNGSLTQP